jgi:O-antigen ligase
VVRRRDRVSLAIGGLALVVAVLVIGGALRWTQSIVAALIAAALIFQLSSRRRLDRVSPLVLLLGLAVIFTAIQLIPLPDWIIRLLDPAGNELRLDGAALAGTSPWQCLSMDPAGTLRGLAFLITLFGVALLSVRFATSERGRYVLLAGVAIACGLAAAVTGVHAIVNADALYGIYEPLHAKPSVLGPLLNSNHLGCLMALGTTVAVGLAFYERQTAQWRTLWVVIAVGCAVVTFASLSRGAALSLVLGVAVTGANLIGRAVGDVSGRRRRDQLPIALVIGVGLALAVYSSAGNVADQLDKTSLTELDHPASKFEAWRSSVALVAETPWVGVGRGALESTFTRVHAPSAYATFSHLENEYIQVIVEWGVPEALAMALVLAWFIITAIRRWRDGPLAAAAFGAIAGVMFQSSVDFGVELLGLAIPVTIVAATLQVVPIRETSELLGLRLQRGVLIAALFAAAAVLLLSATRSVQEDHDDLVAAEAPSLDDLHAAIERHPLDYLAFAQVAANLMQAKNPDAAEFLNHALALHPTHPGLHRLTARLLSANDRKGQAALEYSLAMNGTGAPHLLLTEILANLPGANDAAAAIPLDYRPDTILRSLKELERADVAERWLVRVVAEPVPDIRVVDQLYDMATSRNDLDVALHTAKIRLDLAHTKTSRLMLARVEFLRHDLAAVQAELSDVLTWTDQTDERADARLLLCDTYSEQRQWEVALECIHRLDASGLVASRRLEITRRESEINDQRSAELRAERIQELERSLNLPVDVNIPVIPSHGVAPRPPQPGIGITNPIKNPLLHPNDQRSQPSRATPPPERSGRRSN